MIFTLILHHFSGLCSFSFALMVGRVAQASNLGSGGQLV